MTASITGGAPPRISVVIPYYNGSRFIAEALDSVRRQTLAPTEIIVVDDGSRAEEADELDRRAAGCTIIHQATNRGPSVARNIGIDRASGEWIAFLDCDDLWEPKKLELQAAVAAAHADCVAVHCGIKTIYADGRVVLVSKDDVAVDDFLVFPCPVFPSAVMMKRETLIECGLFNPTKNPCEDLDLFLRVCACGYKFHSVNAPLLIRRIQSDGLSRNTPKFWKEADRVYRDFLPVFADEPGAIAALREVHTDMALRTMYAGDFKLLWRMLRRASRRDVPMGFVLRHALWRIIRNRFARLAT